MFYGLSPLSYNPQKGGSILVKVLSCANVGLEAESIKIWEDIIWRQPGLVIVDHHLSFILRGSVGVGNNGFYGVDYEKLFAQIAAFSDHGLETGQ